MHTGRPNGENSERMLAYADARTLGTHLRRRNGQGYNSAGEAEARVRRGRICVLFSTFVKIFFSFKRFKPPLRPG